MGALAFGALGWGWVRRGADTYSYEYRGLPSNSFCSYILFASLLVAIIYGYNRGHHEKVEKRRPPNQAFVGHVAMDIIWNLGDVERWNPNTPAPEYSRLEEPHLAVNFRSNIL